ncbi:MAG: hypothetical protein QM652_00515 [Legionella sp.]|uniref:hypothetical protein n=1 Tax=Legionella sp. TaxID=459 RepID=UPI0039E67C95
MRKAYIYSYYQSLQYSVSGGMHKNNIETLLRELIKDNKIQVSIENFKKIERLRPTLNYEYEFLTALSCDLEIAIQEQKLILLAQKLGFEVTILDDPDCRPDMDYLETYSMDDIVLDADKLIKGNLYIINTHGREQDMDGPYQQSIYNSLELERIVLDACSSASKNFPMKKSGNRSVVEVVADECIKTNKANSLEIVGYDKPFSTEQFLLTAIAAFSEKSIIVEQCGLTLITIEDRKRVLQKLDEEKQYAAQQAKLKIFAKYENNFSSDDLKNCLIDICSKLSSNFLYRYVYNYRKKLKEDYQRCVVIEFLMTIAAEATGDEHYLQNLLDSDSNVHSKSINKLLEQLKKDRKEYFGKCSHKKLHELAEQTDSVCFKIKQDDDKDLNSSISVLQVMISKSRGLLAIQNDVTKASESQINGQRDRFFSNITDPNCNKNKQVSMEMKVVPEF